MTNDQTAPTQHTLGQRVAFSEVWLRRFHHSSFVIRISSFFLLLLLPHLAHCQSRLDQLEATYESNLRALDAPILQDYLRQLDFLKSQLIARNRADDAKQV